MKRRDEKRRLRFARETLRMISDSQLGEVAGGRKGEPDTMPKSNLWTGSDTDNICSA
jgi:hypothetical protein